VIRDLLDELVEEPEGRSRRLPGASLVLRRTWWVAVGIAVGLAVGLAGGLVLKPDYASTAILTVSSATAGDPSDVSRAAQALARVATAPGVVGQSLRDAGLADVADNPREYVTVEAAPDAPIISVTGTAQDPDTAQRIAATIGGALSRLGPFPPFTATVVAAPPLPRDATRPWWSLPLGAAGVGGALTLVAAATVPARRRRDGALPTRAVSTPVPA
jgi:hypothetical protein